MKNINIKYENCSFGGCSTEGWIKICQKRLGPSVDNIAEDTILTILQYNNIAKDTILTGGKYCNNSGRALNILIIANNGAGAGLINCRPATSFHQYRTVSYKQTKQKIPLIQNITHMATWQAFQGGVLENQTVVEQRSRNIAEGCQKDK